MSVARTIRQLFRLADSTGSQIAEFAVCVPLLTIFAVGVFDFSGAYNLKQKLAGTAQEGALVASSQPTFDLDTGTPTPASVQAIEQAVFLAVADQNVLPNWVRGTGSCGAGPTWTNSGLMWTATTTDCPGTLTIIIDRGCAPRSSPSCPVGSAGEDVIYSHITVTYPYSWRFQNVIGLVGGSAVLPLTITADAYAPNQS